MNLATLQNRFSELTIQRKYKDAMFLIDDALAQKTDSYKIMTDVISKTLQGLQLFDERPEAAGYSSLTLLAIARICDDAIKKILPTLPQSTQKKGRVVIGTPVNEYHGLGKLITSAFLRSYGWEVHDLGLNVDPRTFIEEAQKINADFILVSAFLLPSALRCKEVADALKSSTMAVKPKLIVGGPPFKFHLGLTQKLGCDATAIDAFDMIRLLNQMKGYDKESRVKMEKTTRFQRLRKRIFGSFRKGEGK